MTYFAVLVVGVLSVSGMWLSSSTEPALYLLSSAFATATLAYAVTYDTEER